MDAQMRNLEDVDLYCHCIQVTLSGSLGLILSLTSMTPFTYNPVFVTSLSFSRVIYKLLPHFHIILKVQVLNSIRHQETACFCKAVFLTAKFHDIIQGKHTILHILVCTTHKFIVSLQNAWSSLMKLTARMKKLILLQGYEVLLLSNLGNQGKIDVPSWIMMLVMSCQ